MKHIITLSLLLFSACFTSAQLLQGEWKGEFTYGLFKNHNNRVRIDLKFVLNSDTSYSVYSFTYHSGFKNDCEVYYERYAADSIYLEEVADITKGKKNKDQSIVYFQRMWLKIIIKENQVMLRGVWADAGSIEPKGEVLFWRPRNRQ